MRLHVAGATTTLHKVPDEPFIPEGIPIPGPRPNRSDHPPVSEPHRLPPPPAKEPPAPMRRHDLDGRDKNPGRMSVETEANSWTSGSSNISHPTQGV